MTRTYIQLRVNDLAFWVVCELLRQCKGCFRGSTGRSFYRIGRLFQTILKQCWFRFGNSFKIWTLFGFGNNWFFSVFTCPVKFENQGNFRRQICRNVKHAFISMTQELLFPVGKGMFQISKNFKLLLFEYQQMIVSNCLLKSERWLKSSVKSNPGNQELVLNKSKLL